MSFRILLIICAVLLSGCRSQQLNPPRLVNDGEAETTIQLFVQASILVSRAYGLETITYESFQRRSLEAGFRAIPFMPPETIRATPPSVTRIAQVEGDAINEYLAGNTDIKPLIKYYIKTGLRASQLVCRSHLTRMDEGNQYIEFLKREIGVAATFASGVLTLVNANGTLTKSFLLAVTGVNDGLNAYQDYNYLTIDRDAARILVETAQAKYAEYYLNQVDQAGIQNNVATGGYTLSDALHAVSEIEYQCTREGIRFLLNRSINNTPSNMEIDASTGTVMFKSTKALTDPGTGVGAGALITSVDMKLPLVTPAQPHPSAMSDQRLNSYEASLSDIWIKEVQKDLLCMPTPQDGKLGPRGSATRTGIQKLLAGRSELLTANNGRRLKEKLKDIKSGGLKTC